MKERERQIAEKEEASGKKKQREAYMPPWAASIPYEAEGPVTSHLYSTSTTYVTSNDVARATAPRVTDGPEGDDTLMPPIEQAPRKRERVVGWEG